MKRTVYLVLQNGKVMVDHLERGGIQFGKFYDRKKDATLAAKEATIQIRNWNCPSIRYSVGTATLEVTEIGEVVTVPVGKKHNDYVGQLGIGLPAPEREGGHE